jgi:hypothetical protein
LQALDGARDRDVSDSSRRARSMTRFPVAAINSAMMIST